MGGLRTQHWCGLALHRPRLTVPQLRVSCAAALQVLTPLDREITITPAMTRDLTLMSYGRLMAQFMRGASARSPGGSLAWGKTQACLRAELVDLTVQVLGC